MLHQYEVAPPKPPFGIKGRWRGVAATEGLGGVTAQRRNTAQALAQGGAKSEAAKRLEPRGHGAKRSPQGRNTAQALAQGGAKVWDDHAELRGAWTRNTPRRKIPFSRAKIVSLQFPRPEIRRISAETGCGGGSGGGRTKRAPSGRSSAK